MKIREILSQITSVVKKAPLKQKVLFSLSLIGATLCAGALFFYSLKKPYITLYQENQLSTLEKNERRHLLEEMGIPFREGKGGELQVPKEDIEALRPHFANSSKEVSKGFELFDTNTWIKGDKELQVLEMRALKGQLERDLAGFESIKSARISFDVIPAKKFSGQPQEAKASVILTLVDGTALSFTQLHAITSHISGALPGLKPHMIAVSDTKGRLYQIADSEETENPNRIQRVMQEEKLESDVRLFLDRILGPENYHLTLSGDEKHLEMSLCYDCNSSRFEEEALNRKLQSHLCHLTNELKVEVSALPFLSSQSVEVAKAPLWGFFHVFLFLTVLFTPLVLYVVHVYKTRKRGSNLEEEQLTKIVPKINLEKLAKSLESEDPELIAWTLSYLEPQRAEKIISRFPPQFQEEVLEHLSALEEEEM